MESIDKVQYVPAIFCFQQLFFQSPEANMASFDAFYIPTPAVKL